MPFTPEQQADPWRVSHWEVRSCQEEHKRTMDGDDSQVLGLQQAEVRTEGFAVHTLLAIHDLHRSRAARFSVQDSEHSVNGNAAHKRGQQSGSHSQTADSSCKSSLCHLLSMASPAAAEASTNVEKHNTICTVHVMCIAYMYVHTCCCSCSMAATTSANHSRMTRWEGAIDAASPRPFDDSSSASYSCTCPQVGCQTG